MLLFLAETLRISSESRSKVKSIFRMLQGAGGLLVTLKVHRRLLSWSCSFAFRNLDGNHWLIVRACGEAVHLCTCYSGITFNYLGRDVSINFDTKRQWNVRQKYFLNSCVLSPIYATASSGLIDGFNDFLLKYYVSENVFC